MHKVLIVDDEPAQIDLLCAMLTVLDVECIAAHSGLEAIEVARKLQPHLIIMDWIMPAETLTGDAATRQILSDPSINHIPVIACSTVTNLGDAAQSGVVDCIYKPFTRDSLLSKVKPYLN